jgi:hypothetical protein
MVSIHLKKKCLDESIMIADLAYFLEEIEQDLMSKKNLIVKDDEALRKYRQL